MSEEVTVQQLECNRCGHHWYPRPRSNVPQKCPGCNSPYWNKPRVRHLTYMERDKLARPRPEGYDVRLTKEQAAATMIGLTQLIQTLARAQPEEQQYLEPARQAFRVMQVAIGGQDKGPE